VVNTLARPPRPFLWIAGAFVLLVLAVWLGLHHAVDRAVAAVLWQDVPCWGRTVSERASVLFAAELSVLYALAFGFVCLRKGKFMAAGWILFLMLAGVGIEIAFKFYFTHPSPGAYLETLPREACGLARSAYPFTVVPTPSTLPSGYTIRAAYFSVLLAGLVGARWPRLRLVAWSGFGAFAILAGASRVTVGWHWPTDVVAGLLLGSGFAILALAMADNFTWLRPGGARSGRPGKGQGRGRAPARAGGSSRRPAGASRSRAS
jgi:membrane-associated phospholipid phosphatase